jgi:hypothetical protein
MAVHILRHVYLSTVTYVTSVVVAMFNPVAILLPVPAHIYVYSVAIYSPSPVAQLFATANQ